MGETRADSVRGSEEEAGVTVALTRSARLGLVALVIGALTAVSCERLVATKIAKIAAEPGKYEGKDVTVFGTVKERIDVPSIKCYVLSDGKASIGVVTQGRLPLVGEKARGQGRVSRSFAIGVRKLLVIIETPKPRPTLPRNPAVPGNGPG
ncbi:MAG: hypothetical protein MUO25_13885 [Thermoanaerobaculaceae bacterium]|nr:hypothetical protein [Thermoanaerobaculaceae bacterium]